MDILKTILKRLENIEERLENEKTGGQTAKPAAQTHPQQAAQIQPIQQNDSLNLEKTRQEAKSILIDAKDEAFRIKQAAEDESRRLKQEILNLERRVLQKEEQVGAKLSELERQGKEVEGKNAEIQKRVAEVEKAKLDLIAKLEKVGHLTKDEAKDLILRALEEKLKEDMAKKIREIEEKTKEEAGVKVREILIEAMRHGATDYVTEFTVSTIKLPDEEFKGRIIGKEGRNIRAFEMATGVDVDLDEEGVIRFSSFDPVRREIARISLEKLMKDGRIQPVKIEEVVHQTKGELDKIMFEEGQKLCQAVGVYNMPQDKVQLLGRFKYRFSYGQNMIAHTLEETKIGIALAHELKADVNVVRLGCLLHDIGKVITDKEGSHVSLGVELLKKNGMPDSVIGCVAAHHEDIPFPSLEAVIVYIADAISGARPGARYEDYDQYVKRLKDLEGIALQHAGVNQVYALQAGREIRIIVDPGKIDDAGATVLSHKIKEEIEKKFPTFPGQIKITIIRELRVIETVH